MDKREGEERPDRQPLNDDGRHAKPSNPSKLRKQDDDRANPGRPQNPKAG